MSPRRNVIIGFVGIALLYAAAINPYFLPEVYDNIVYFFGAQSLATDGSYRFDGFHIVDWPPGFSWLLSLPMHVGIVGIAVSKAIVVLSVLVGLGCAYRLFVREERVFPLLTVALTAVLPTSYMMGTRLMSEWPYIAWSMGFLLVLERLRTDRRSWLWAVFAGFLFGAAVMTRYAGVALGAAVMVQAANRWRVNRTLSSIRYEMLVAVLGAVPFVMWRLQMAAHLRAGTAVARYQTGAGIVSHFDLPYVGHGIADLLLHLDRVAGLIHLPLPFQWMLWLGAAAVIAFGLWRSVKESGRLRPSDAYVIASLALITVIEWKYTRYLLPVAVFLVSYVLTVLRAAADRFDPSPKLRGLISVKVIAWGLLLLAMDDVFLIKGNGKTHGGLLLSSSPAAESFYRGAWLDLYRVSIKLGSLPGEEPLGMYDWGKRKYLMAFSNRQAVDYVGQADVRYVLAQKGVDMDKGLREANPPVVRHIELVPELSSGELVVYRVALP